MWSYATYVFFILTHYSKLPYLFVVDISAAYVANANEIIYLEVLLLS